LPQNADQGEERENKYLIVTDYGQYLHNHKYKVIDSLPTQFGKLFLTKSNCKFRVLSIQ